MSSDTPQESPKPRPLSPYWIYRPQITSVTSIFHRMSGVVLTLGLLVLAWGLISLASGDLMYQCFMKCMTSPVGWAFLFGWSAAFFYHSCTGVRHLLFDSGLFFKKKQAAISGWVVLGTSATLTAVFWAMVVCKLGGMS